MADFSVKSSGATVLVDFLTIELINGLCLLLLSVVLTHYLTRYKRRSLSLLFLHDIRPRPGLLAKKL